MRLAVEGTSQFQCLHVSLGARETFLSEAGKFVHGSSGIDMDVTTRSKGTGGILGALKRMVGGDAFFLTTYRAPAAGAELVLAPDLVGEVAVLELDGTGAWLCAGGSYMAHGPDILIETRFQGVRGFLTGESLFFVEASGQGPLVVNAFGAIETVRVDSPYVVDTGHVVAFESTLEYTISRAGRSWLQSFLAGEGFVMQFRGHGRLMVQSHNPKAFGRLVGPRLPAR